MKPTSVIFLIISVLLACVGVLLMVTAGNMADTQGVALFVQTGDSNNNYTGTHEFEGSEIKKIVLSLSEVDVNIYGGADKNYIELVNFPDGTYQFSTSKSTLQLNDTTAISNIVDVDNLKINFNGFRDYLHYFKYRDKARSLNVYLSDDAAAIIFNVTTTGNVTLNDLSVNCDYKIKVSDGNVEINNVKTDSSIIIDSTDDSNIDLNNVTVNEIEINGATAYATLKRTTVVRALYIKILSGDVNYDRVESDFTGFNVHFETKSGIINWGDERVINGVYTEENYVDISKIIEQENKDSETAAEDSESNTETDDPTENTEEDLSSEEAVEAYTVTIIVNEGNITVY